MKMNRNLVDLTWINRPPPNNNVIKVHYIEHAGEKWQSKLNKLRRKLIEDHCDAMIVTSLTEVAYLLNLRGNDLPYTPVFKVISIDTAISLLFSFFFIFNSMICFFCFFFLFIILCRLTYWSR